MNGVDVPKLVLHELACLPITEQTRAAGDRQRDGKTKCTEHRVLQGTSLQVIYTRQPKFSFRRTLVSPAAVG